MCVHMHACTHEISYGKTCERRNKKIEECKKSVLENGTQYTFFFPQSAEIKFYQMYMIILKNENAFHKENRNIEAFLQAERKWD